MGVGARGGRNALAGAPEPLQPAEVAGGGATGGCFPMLCAGPLGRSALAPSSHEIPV